MMSDLRESGSIEQDADAVMLLFREGYYENEQQGGAGSSAPASSHNGNSNGVNGSTSIHHLDGSTEAQVIVAKNRNGPTGTVPLRFVAHLARFENAA